MLSIHNKSNKVLFWTVGSVLVIGFLGIGLLLAFKKVEMDKGLYSYESVVSLKSVGNFLFDKSMAIDAQRTNSKIYIYSQGMSFVDEVRKAKLKKGRNTINIVNVPRGIDQSSILVRSNDSGFQILKQVFRPEVSNNDLFLDNFLGKEVVVTNYTDRSTQSVSGVLIGRNNGIVLKNDSSVDVMSRADRLSLPIGSSEEIQPFPVVSVDAMSAESKDYDLNAMYLTSDFSWDAKYTAIINEEGNIDLTGWANITNNSGVSFPDAKLTLVAGQMNTQNNPVPMYGMERVKTFDAVSAPVMSEDPTSLFEYHLYNLKDLITLDNSRSQSVAFLYNPQIKTKKVYLYENGSDSKRPLSLKLMITNSKENGLGMTIPSGLMRIYSEGTDGSVYLGESYLDQFSVGQDKEVSLSQAMDILGDRVVKDVKVKPGIPGLGKTCTDQTVVINIYNNSKEAKDVLIRDYLPGTEARITKINKKDYTRVSNNKIELNMNLASGQTDNLEYTVEYCY